jgi:septum formation protein
MQLILASGSKNRKQLLQLAGWEFDVVPPHIDEVEITDKKPRKRVEKVALAKAQAVAKTHPNRVIIAADTVALYRNTVLEKPKFKMDALHTLTTLSGTSHLMITGWCVLNSNTHEDFSGVAETRVYFRELDEEQLLNYVNDVDVVQFAAGYSPLNTRAIEFIEKIEGSLSGFSHGLPLEKIAPVVAKFIGQ